MRIHTLLATAFLAGAAAAPAAAQSAPELPADFTTLATADIVGTDGKTIGQATFTKSPEGSVLVSATVEGIEPGSHGFHVHETGECDPATGFKSAGGHLANGKNHGLVEGGPHPGDMPNQTAGADGKLVAEVFNDLLTEDLLFDADGSALMVHSKPDDYHSQPSGEAGDRVACGVLKPAS